LQVDSYNGILIHNPSFWELHTPQTDFGVPNI
jgi:hypothetical protein